MLSVDLGETITVAVGQPFNRKLKSLEAKDGSRFFQPLLSRNRKHHAAFLRHAIGERATTIRGGGDLGFTKRQIEKTIAGGNVPERNQQFEIIEALRNRYFDEKNPVYSIDTKKKELLGTFYRKGRAYSQEPFRAFDHDFPSWSSGKIVPHGIWDPIRNHGHLNLGLSSDTSQFACDSFRWFWKRIGRYHYPDATSMLWLCDAGGSNNCRHYIFKQDLQELANEFNPAEMELHGFRAG